MVAQATWIIVLPMFRPRTPALINPPTRVGDLALPGLETSIRCPKCGRVVLLQPAKLKVSDRMLLTDFLAHLECNEARNFRKCGGRPEAIEIRYTPPTGPARSWSMDRAGAWTDVDDPS